MTNSDSSPTVLVQVISVDGGREIGWGSNVAERLEYRLEDVRKAVAAGTQAVADSLAGLPSAEGWRLSEATAKFGITLAAHAGVILSAASAGATFEVRVRFQRDQ